MFPWFFGGVISSWEVACGFPGFCEELVVFGSTFFGAGFGSVWAFGDGIGSNDVEHIQQQAVLLAGACAGSIEDGCPVA